MIRLALIRSLMGSRMAVLFLPPRYTIRESIDDLTGRSDRHGLCADGANQNPIFMSENHIERLRKLEDAYDAKQNARLEAELRAKEQMVKEKSAKGDFLKNVVSPALSRAGEQMGAIGWVLNPASENLQHKDGSTVLATLPRKNWAITIDLVWTTATQLSMECTWGLPDRRNPRPSIGMSVRNAYPRFDITTATVDEVFTNLMEVLLEVTEKNTKNRL